MHRSTTPTRVWRIVIAVRFFGTNSQFGRSLIALITLFFDFVDVLVLCKTKRYLWFISTATPGQDTLEYVLQYVPVFWFSVLAFWLNLSRDRKILIRLILSESMNMRRVCYKKWCDINVTCGSQCQRSECRAGAVSNNTSNTLQNVDLLTRTPCRNFTNFCLKINSIGKFCLQRQCKSMGISVFTVCNEVTAR